MYIYIYIHIYIYTHIGLTYPSRHGRDGSQASMGGSRSTLLPPDGGEGHPALPPLPDEGHGW